jgi:hypothetical protein
MVGKALFAVSLTIGGLLGPGVAHAENIMNLGTYAGDVIKQLQDWGTASCSTASIGTSPTWMRPTRGIVRCSGFIRW